MIDIAFLEDKGILTLTPDSRISDADVKHLKEALARHIDGAGDVRALLVDSRLFPGYEDVAAWKGHLDIVRHYHRKIGRIALVSDSGIASTAEALGRALGVDIRHFPYNARNEALAWLGA